MVSKSGKPISFHCPLTQRDDVLGFNEIFEQLSLLNLCVYTPAAYILPSRVRKYIDLYNAESGDDKENLSLYGREKGLQALMTTNLLKRLESSIQSFRLTLHALRANHVSTLETIRRFMQGGGDAAGTGEIADRSDALAGLEADEDDLSMLTGGEIGGKVRISLADMDLPSWEHDLAGDLEVIEALLASMTLITPEDDAKLQHLKSHVLEKIANPINPGNKKVLIFTALPIRPTTSTPTSHLSCWLCKGFTPPR